MQAYYFVNVNSRPCPFPIGSFARSPHVIVTPFPIGPAKILPCATHFDISARLFARGIFIALTMKAVRTSETWSISTRVHGAISQMAVVFRPMITFRKRKINKKFEHLSTVTIEALC
jgi:hypothetical protein